MGITVDEKVRDVGEGASVVGSEIQRLVTVPWRTPEVRVRLDARKVQGKVVGLAIREVVEDYRRIPLRTFREMALLGPLRRLRELHPERRVVVWIDGLDEEAGANEGKATGDLTIGNLLPVPDDVADLGNLTLILSSRPSQVLDRFLDEGATVIDLGDDRFTADNAALVKRYIDQKLADEVMIQRITEANTTPEAMSAKLIDSSEGNLLYLRHVFLAARIGELPALLEGDLPSGLQAVYARLVGRLVRATGRRGYIEDVGPLLGVLAVAASGLTAKQLGSFTGLDERVKIGLGQLSPFLDVIASPAGDSVFTLYHSSFRDTLISEANRDEVWHVNPEQAHGQIAKYYLQLRDAEWSRLDDYGFEFLTHHLAHGGIEMHRLLLTLIDENWRRLSRLRSHSHRRFAADLERAALAAQQLPFPEGLTETARLTLMATRVADAEREVPVLAIEVMSRLGQVERALDSFRADFDTHDFIRRLASLIRGLSPNESKRSLCRRLLGQGLDRLARRPDHDDLADLLEAMPPSEDPAMAELFQRAIDVFNGGPASWTTPRALAELARLATALPQFNAGDVFEQALDAVERFTTTSRGIELARVLDYLARTDPGAALEALGSHAPPAGRYGVMAITDVYRAAAEAGHPVSLEDVDDALIPQVAALTDPFEHATTLVALANLEIELGRLERADRSLTEALRRISAIGGPDDPDAALQNRAAQATTALMLAADVHLDIDAARGRETLQRTWTSLEEHGYWAIKEAAEALLRAQLRSTPDVLTPRVRRLPQGELRAEFLLRTAIALDESEPEAVDRAQELLDEALDLSERPRANLSGHAAICLSVAQAISPEHRDAAQALLDGSGLDAESIVSWRLSVLSRLADRDHPGASRWLDETVRRWAESVSNPNYIADLPASVQALPEPLVGFLTGTVSNLTGAHHRMLAAAVSARLYPTDPVAAERLLNSALEEVDGAHNGRNLAPLRTLLAFAAGQWWEVDRSVGEALLLDALLRVESEAASGDPRQWSYQLLTTVDNLARGAPAAALRLLLAHLEPPAEPNTFLVIAHGPLTPPLLAAGMSERDHLLAVVLARVLGRVDPAIDPGARLANPAARSLVAATAAATQVDASIEQRLAWCEAAVKAANEVEEHYLRCLQLADAARAFDALGVTHRARQLAAATAKEVLDEGYSYEAIWRDVAYPHALGSCFEVLVRGANRDVVPGLVWDARRLGRVLPSALAHLGPALVEAGSGEALVDANNQAMTLFTSSSR